MTIHCPPGCRLGIDLCGVLEPGFGRSALIFASSNWATEKWPLTAGISLRPWFGERAKDPDWSRDPKKCRLDNETPVTTGVAKRVWTYIGADRDEPLRAFAFAHEDGLEPLTIECHRSKGASKKWRDVIERILASAQLRAPVSLDQFFAEHRFMLGDTGLFATHFGVQLHLTPVKPETPADNWRRTRIQVNAPVDDDDDDPRRRALDHKRETRIGDVRWFIRTEPLSLPNGLACSNRDSCCARPHCRGHRELR